MPDTSVLSRIFADAFVLAILIFTLTITLARLMGEMHGYAVDSDQELVAYGACNFFSSFFRCIVTCTAPPRTMILSNTGAKSTLNNVVIAAFIFIVVLAASQLFTALPVAVLAVMIASAVKNLLMQVTQLPELWRISKPDFLIWVVTCVTCVLGDLDIGIAIGIGFSILTVIFRNQFTSGSVGGMARNENIVLYGKNRDGVKEGDNYRIFYFPSQLYFSNAERFCKELFSKCLDPSDLCPVGKEDNNGNADKETLRCDSSSSSDIKISPIQNEIKYVILDCSAITFIDVAGSTVLKKIVNQYKKVGVAVLLAKCPSNTLALLQRSGYFGNDDEEKETAFYDVQDAIAYIQQGAV